MISIRCILLFEHPFDSQVWFQLICTKTLNTNRITVWKRNLLIDRNREPFALKMVSRNRNSSTGGDGYDDDDKKDIITRAILSYASLLVWHSQLKVISTLGCDAFFETSCVCLQTCMQMQWKIVIDATATSTAYKYGNKTTQCCAMSIWYLWLMWRCQSSDTNWTTAFKRSDAIGMKCSFLPSQRISFDLYAILMNGHTDNKQRVRVPCTICIHHTDDDDNDDCDHEPFHCGWRLSWWLPFRQCVLSSFIWSLYVYSLPMQMSHIFICNHEPK